MEGGHNRFTELFTTKLIHKFPVIKNLYKEAKAIAVTGRRGPWGCETSKLSYLLHNRLTDGGEVVLRAGRSSSPRKFPVTHFCHKKSRYSTIRRVTSIEKSSDFIGNRTHDHQACSIVPI
jgi:hypothetical protein